MAGRIKNTLLWISLILISMLIHLSVSWKAADQFITGSASSSSSNAEEFEEVVIELSNTQVVPEEPEQLLFEQPIEFEPPELLMSSQAATRAPDSASKALKAAAGGLSGAIGTVASAPQIPLTQGYGSAGFGAGTGNGLSNSSHQFAAYVESLRETGLDVVFVVDVTGSMGWVLLEVNQRIADIVDSVRSLVPVARFGVVAYRDFDDAEFVTRIQPLTFSLTKLTRFLNDLEAAGGGDWQEAIYAAMTTAVNDAGWRPDASRVVIIIGDAPPHDENYRSLLKRIENFVGNGGQVSSLDVSDDANPGLVEARVGRPVNRALYRGLPMTQFQAIADAGNGRAATLDGDVQITRQLLSLIMGGQFSAEMNLLFDGL